MTNDCDPIKSMKTKVVLDRTSPVQLGDDIIRKNDGEFAHK